MLSSLVHVVYDQNMQNPALYLYDLKIASHHPENPGPVSYAMSRATGMPTAICRNYVNGDLRDEYFIRGVTYTFALSVKKIVTNAGGSVELWRCPWSPQLKLDQN